MIAGRPQAPSRRLLAHAMLQVSGSDLYFFKAAGSASRVKLAWRPTDVSTFAPSNILKDCFALMLSQRVPSCSDNTCLYSFLLRSSRLANIYMHTGERYMTGIRLRGMLNVGTGTYIDLLITHYVFRSVRRPGAPSSLAPKRLQDMKSTGSTCWLFGDP